MKALVFFVCVIGLVADAGADPQEGILTYYDPEVPGNNHVFIRNDRFATLIEPDGFGVPDSLWVIRGIWSLSGMFGNVRVALCEDDTTDPEWDHFPGDTIRFVDYFDPLGTEEDFIYFDKEITREDNRNIWIFFDYEIDGIPFRTSGTNPPAGRNLVRTSSPRVWWSDIDDWSVGLIVRYEPGVGIGGDEEIPVPRTFALHPNFPNPFNPSTTIGFDLPETEEVSLAIYDFHGRLVRNLISDRMRSGHHELVWDGRDDAGRPVSSGAYLYRLRAGDQRITRKMILVK